MLGKDDASLVFVKFFLREPKKVWAEWGGVQKVKVSSGTFRSYGIRVMGPTLFL
jgi:hypothetical protein